MRICTRYEVTLWDHPLIGAIFSSLGGSIPFKESNGMARCNKLQQVTYSLIQLKYTLPIKHHNFSNMKTWSRWSLKLLGGECVGNVEMKLWFAQIFNYHEWKKKSSFLIFVQEFDPSLNAVGTFGIVLLTKLIRFLNFPLTVNCFLKNSTNSQFSWTSNHVAYFTSDIEWK